MVDHGVKRPENHFRVVNRILVAGTLITAEKRIAGRIGGDVDVVHVDGVRRQVLASTRPWQSSEGALPPTKSPLLAAYMVA